MNTKRPTHLCRKAGYLQAHKWPAWPTDTCEQTRCCLRDCGAEASRNAIHDWPSWDDEICQEQIRMCRRAGCSATESRTLAHSWDHQGEYESNSCCIQIIHCRRKRCNATTKQEVHIWQYSSDCTRRDCSRCHISIVKCPQCSGTGRIGACPDCGGEGVVPHTRGSMMDNLCPCGGNAGEECSNCGGSGYVETSANKGAAPNGGPASGLAIRTSRRGRHR